MLELLLKLLEYTILGEVILSYIPNLKSSPIYGLITSFNYPVLEPFRMLQNKIFGISTVDFSPILAILFLNFIRMMIL